MDVRLALLWLGLTLAFAVLEAVTVGLTGVWFAAGALCALIASLLGAPLPLQIGLFIVVSILCLLAVRPLARKHLNNRVQATNADRVIGQQARVTQEIDNLQGSGAVAVDGKVWTARSDSGSTIPEGSLVRVLRIEGVKLFVELIKEEVSCRT